ncbi:MAG: hypothetical protein AABM43_07850 [Actinomycetota bacterium]
MTSQGSAYGRFRKSLDRGNVNFALEAAAELETVSLADALELCVLLAAAGDSRYQAAARRWLGRLLEEKGASLTEALIAGAALAELGERPNSPLARDTLEQLLESPS